MYRFQTAAGVISVLFFFFYLILLVDLGSQHQRGERDALQVLTLSLRKSNSGGFSTVGK